MESQSTAHAAMKHLAGAIFGPICWLNFRFINPANLAAYDADGTQFFWQLIQAPRGMTLNAANSNTDAYDENGIIIGYANAATLSWHPDSATRAATPADSEVIVRVQDSRGGVATRRFTLSVEGGNTLPVIDAFDTIYLEEGQPLQLPLSAADADGDTLTLTVKNLPAGAVFNAATGMLTWTPGYNQAGQYNNITVQASDGKSTTTQSFSVNVSQGYAQPVLRSLTTQTLREGEAYAVQFAGSMPGGGVTQTSQPDGTTITLDYSTPWLPGGASLNSETGFFTWTPGYAQHGSYNVPVTVTATYSGPGVDNTYGPLTTSVTRELTLKVLNANGAPEFDRAETWNILEGQPLRVSVFAFDPDNPSFEPKIRLSPNGTAGGPETTAPTVSYQVSGLPPGASFDAETMEIIWTPSYAQAGTYYVQVIATDDGDGTSTPAISELTLPIIVTNANRAPVVGSIRRIKGASVELIFAHPLKPAPTNILGQIPVYNPFPEPFLAAWHGAISNTPPSRRNAISKI